MTSPSVESCTHRIVSLEPFVLECGHYPDVDFRGSKSIGDKLACIGCYKGLPVAYGRGPEGPGVRPETLVSPETQALFAANVPSSERCPGCGGVMVPGSPGKGKRPATPAKCAKNCYLGNLHVDARNRVIKVMLEIAHEAGYYTPVVFKYVNKGVEHPTPEAEFFAQRDVRQAFYQALRNGENPNRACEEAKLAAHGLLDSDAEFLKQRIAYAVHSDAKPPDTLCSLCGEHQFETPSGTTCKNGHGGAQGTPIERPFGESSLYVEIENTLRNASGGTWASNVRSLSLQSLRELVRPHSEGLVLEIDRAIQSGRYVVEPAPQAPTKPACAKCNDTGSINIGDAAHPYDYPCPENCAAAQRAFLDGIGASAANSKKESMPSQLQALTSPADSTIALASIPHALDDQRPRLAQATTESAQALAIARDAQVRSPEALEWAGGATKHAKDWIDYLDAEREKLTRPLLDQKNKVDDVFMPAIKNWREVERDLKSKIGQYHGAQRAEQERVMRESAQVYAQGGIPTQIVPVVVSTEGVGVRETWDFEIVSPMLVPRELCSPDPAKIESRRQVEMANTNEPPNIPGLRFFKTQQVRVTRR